MTTAIIPETSDDRTILDIVQAMAKNVGISVPDVVVTSSERAMVEALRYANEVGEELARRVDWGALTVTTILTGTGASLAHTLPTDFDRIPQGAAVTYGVVPLRALSRAEWNTLTAAEGTPRYFLLENETVTLWPYLASADTVNLTYISEQWSSSGSEVLLDTDTVVFPDDLFTLGLIVRWRRQKGMDYADFEAEYEAMLADYAKFSDRSRF